MAGNSIAGVLVSRKPLVVLSWPPSKLELAPELPPLRSREIKDVESNELVSKGLHWLVFRTEEGGVALAARSKFSINTFIKKKLSDLKKNHIYYLHTCLFTHTEWSPC